MKWFASTRRFSSIFFSRFLSGRSLLLGQIRYCYHNIPLFLHFRRDCLNQTFEFLQGLNLRRRENELRQFFRCSLLDGMTVRVCCDRHFSSPFSFSSTFGMG